MTTPTTHDDDATTWRDLADQLTDQERSAIEQIEHAFAARGRLDTAEATETLLGYARDHIAANLADVAYCDVPVPAGASSVGHWEKNLKRDGWSRSLLWRKFRDSDMGLHIDIDGSQQCDGSYTCEISLYGLEDDINLTSAGARRLMVLLAEAADELDRLK
jgi:hypothetical protein